ncbi:NAD(P)/FAD-dependent oxidoreductase [Rhodohalobacter sp. 8-1]|uniref:NAD(P)/FAD-dependent oxidoreductase n=1 Tax=Rhodohalobacter sp. 8-1 TaxID=3131972 RepID=UPI0030EB900D
MKPTILVLGGGIGGVHAAKQLSREIGNEDGINLARILVFERKKQSLYAPSLTWLMVGKREQNEIYKELSKIEYNGIEVIEGEIEKIDPKAKTVTSNGKTCEGDYIIASLGVSQNNSANLISEGHNFYTVDGAESFHNELRSFTGNRISILVSSLPYKSPVAPYEAAMLIDNYLRENDKRQEVEIHLYTPEVKPMPFANSEISSHVVKLMQEKDIYYHPSHQFVKEKQDKIEFRTGSDDTFTANPGLLAYTPEHIAPAVLSEAGLTEDSGWVEPNPDTLETKFDNVYVIGDVIELSGEKNQPMPKAGIFAQHQAEVVAHNIARKISGKSPDRTFKYKGSYILDSGNRADKISGDFEKGGNQSSKSGALRHWEKVISEKAWFLNNF